MNKHPSTFKKLTDRHNLADTGQAALVMVIGFTLLLTIFGGVMVNSYVNNAPILTQASLQRYAYRALASGLSAYQSAINANPYLAACNTDNGSNPQCAGITYQSWSQVTGTNVGNGVSHHLSRGPDRRRRRVPGEIRLLLNRGPLHPAERLPGQRMVVELRVL